MEQLFNIGKGGSSSGAGMPEPGRLPGLGGAGPADFSKLLGKDLAGQDMKQLAQQADALWKFLDEMAENDEEGYKKFIEQQAEAAAEASKLAGQAGGEGGMQGLVADTAPAMLVEAPASGGSLPPGSIAVIQIWRASKGELLGKRGELDMAAAVLHSVGCDLPPLCKPGVCTNTLSCCLLLLDLHTACCLTPG